MADTDRSQPARVKSLSLAAPLLLVVSVAAVYTNSIRGAFVFDDAFMIKKNPNVLHLWPIWRAMGAPPDSGVAGRPVVAISYAINYSIGEFDVRGYHVFNVVIHAMATLALFGVVNRTLCGPRLADGFGSRATSLALSVALLWGVHPLLTDTVTYLTSRTELMMGMFMFLTLYCFIRGSNAPAKGRRWYALALASCALGMGCKEVMVAAPLLVILYDFLFVAKAPAELLRQRWPVHTMLLATWIIIPLLLLHASWEVKTGFGTQLSSWLYLKTQASMIVHYLRLSLWPSGLVIDYGDWLLAERLTDVLPQAALLVALLIATAYAIARRWPVGFLGAWFFLILAPTSSFLPLSNEVGAERRMYLPLAAVVTLVVLGVYRAMWQPLTTSPAMRRLAVATVACVAIALGIGTVLRNGTYASELTIWQDAVAKRPDNPRSHYNLGQAYSHEERDDLAVSEYRRAIELEPGDPYFHFRLGLSYDLLGQPEDALREYRESVRLNPKYFESRFWLGQLLARQGKFDEAIEHLAMAVQLEPGNDKAKRTLALAMKKAGR